MQKAAANKILLLGVDGLDPRLTRKYVDKGIMPNVKKLIERGACREDLVLLGANPPVTPPQWTTLATGAYPMTHGITCFFRQHPTELDAMEYNLDSRLCKAEQLWNVFAEAGKKTLVWHWPGSSWPPSSDSPNLMVVDGTAPGSVAMGNCQREAEYMVIGDARIKEVTILPKAASSASAPCVIEDVDVISDKQVLDVASASTAAKTVTYVMNENEGSGPYTGSPFDIAKSPIKEATGWANAPADAKEFTLLLSNGMIRRPSLILKNAEGKYDRVAIYKSKKDAEPIRVLTLMKMERQIIDECIKNDVHYTVNRNMELVDIAEDGNFVKVYVSAAMDINNDDVWHPKSLYKTICDNIGYPTPTSQLGGQDPVLINEIMLQNWYATADWQADSIKYLIENEGVEVVFSHFHAVDLQEHIFIRFMSANDTKDGHWKNEIPVENFHKFMEDIYIQVDYYVGKFIDYLDKGWLIALFSDHAQVCPAHKPPMIGDMAGVNVRVMEELGYTFMKRDADGNELREIDWSRTKAIANRGNHIYINVKGRWEHGIVEPEDQYEVEEQLMTDLYGYRDKKTGKRVVSLAIRNRDAALLGLSGPECGDIVYFTAEGYNYDHCDSLSTTLGDADTSVSPIFIIAGPGVKQGYTDRVIRQVDFAPTIATLGGVRMPKQCEGAPVYQILEEVF